MSTEEKLKIVNDLKNGRYKSISKFKISESDLLDISHELKLSKCDVVY